MSADGSVRIDVDLSTDNAERELSSLKRKIKTTQNEIEELSAKKSDTEQKIASSVSVLDNEKVKLARLKAELEEIRAVAKDTSFGSISEQAKADIPHKRQEVAEQAERVRLLQNEFNKVDGQLVRYNERLAAAERKLKRQVEEAGNLQEQINKAGRSSNGMSRDSKRTSKSMSDTNKRASLLGKSIAQVAKRFFILNVIAKVLQSVFQWFGKIIKATPEARQALATLRGALLTIAQPLVDVVVPAFTFLVNVLSQVAVAIARVVSAVFGKTIEQSSAAAESLYNQTEALNGVGSAAKKAGKSLAAFDEINQLSKAETGSGNSSIGANFDFSNIAQGGAMSIVQKGLADLVNAFSGLSNIDIGPLGKSLKTVWKAVSGLAKIVWKDLLWGIENVIVPITEIAVEKDAPTFFTVLASVIELLGIVTEKVNGILKIFWTEFLKPVLEYAAEKFAPVFRELNKQIKEFSKLMEESGAWDDFETILTVICKVLVPIVKGLIDFTAEVAKFVLPQAWIDAKYLFLDLADVLGIIAALASGDVSDAVDHLYDLLIDNRVNKSKEKIDLLKESFGLLKDKIEETSKTLAEKLPEWWETSIEPWFTKEKWKTLGQNIKTGLADGIAGTATTVISILNSIIGGFESLINEAADGINGLIAQYNEWAAVTPLVPTTKLRMRHVTLNRIDVPKLAQGAVIPPNREFMAVLGDQKSGTNIETPLATMVQAFKQALGESGGGGSQTIILQIDGREFGRAVKKYGNTETQRVGVSLVGVRG